MRLDCRPTHKDACNVSGGEQIAGGCNSAPQGALWDYISIQQLGKSLQDLPSDTRQPTDETVEARCNGCTRGRDGLLAGAFVRSRHVHARY